MDLGLEMELDRVMKDKINKQINKQTNKQTTRITAFSSYLWVLCTQVEVSTKVSQVLKHLNYQQQYHYYYFLIMTIS